MNEREEIRIRKILFEEFRDMFVALDLQHVLPTKIERIVNEINKLIVQK